MYKLYKHVYTVMKLPVCVLLPDSILCLLAYINLRPSNSSLPFSHKISPNPDHFLLRVSSISVLGAGFRGGSDGAVVDLVGLEKVTSWLDTTPGYCYHLLQMGIQGGPGGVNSSSIVRSI